MIFLPKHVGEGNCTVYAFLPPQTFEGEERLSAGFSDWR